MGIEEEADDCACDVSGLATRFLLERVFQKTYTEPNQGGAN